MRSAGAAPAALRRPDLGRRELFLGGRPAPARRLRGRLRGRAVRRPVARRLRLGVGNLVGIGMLVGAGVAVALLADAALPRLEVDPLAARGVTDLLASRLEAALLLVHMTLGRVEERVETPLCHGRPSSNRKA